MLASRKSVGDVMGDAVRIAVVGAGLVGQRHIAAIAQVPGTTLAAIVDPAGSEDAEVPVHADLDQLFAGEKVDGIILSTPTPLHVEGALRCVAEGVPVLVEKPLATSSTQAMALLQKAEVANVPVLVGHHRRHNPLIQQAASLIHQGALGEIRAAQAMCWFYKPDDYFEVAPWRKQQGAGPTSVNLVHDIDLMRHLCGEVVSVQAQMVPSRRGFDNEDISAAVLQFDNGALGTITVSDSIVSPWSWEMTAREYPIYPVTDQSCYWIGGSDGALSLPDMKLWRHDGEKSWWNGISATTMPRAASDPLINQIVHFAQVIRGEVPPLVTATEGLRTLQVVEAIQEAAASQTLVRISDPAGAPQEAAQ